MQHIETPIAQRGAPSGGPGWLGNKTQWVRRAGIKSAKTHAGIEPAKIRRSAGIKPAKTHAGTEPAKITLLSVSSAGFQGLSREP